ncbi:RpiB/LacA/LacB family sugar-phosphate isomerase [Streptomyces sennicomposti]|uniref:RpiB/LacA/LacB family sugar-phosphate isomerase n=1 Tax=Streptomyces sennicomposti TaxID=2873384 RepID=UPI001CA7A2C7|nr:RpiB/LacA/LacB family sugar-phosphate isomerase [Streptomyces sennicomposti]MBY8869881.1 RpiB/LacA/LacB family sugar-phosphate isomerase [Streptomyces sennicomposti]
MSTQDPRLRIVVGSDAAGRFYKDALADELRANAMVAEVLDIGVDEHTQATYPEIAFAAGRLIADGQADRALLVCHTGLGVAIAANKVRGIRAVTAHDALSVRAAVCSNNAQVLTFGQGIIGLGLARRLTIEWLTYRFDPGSSAAAKVRVISDFEQQHLPVLIPGGRA